MKIKNALLAVATAASISVAGALPAMAQTAETTEPVTTQQDSTTGSASGTAGQTPNQPENQAGSSNSGATEGTTGEASDGSSTQGSADFFGWTGNESGLDRFADVAKLIGSIAGIIGAIVGVLALL